MDDNLKLEIEDKNGKKYNINIVAKFDDGEDDYVIANDCDDNSKNYIFKLEVEDDDEVFVSIDDEKELERLSLIANKTVLEEFK